MLAALLLAGGYLFFCTKEYLASHFADQPALASLQRAMRVEPGDAEYPYRTGRYFWLIEHSPEAAVSAYRAAVALNPHQARYWLDLAAAYQLLGNSEDQRPALEQAIAADPTTPEIAWEAANLYVADGDTEKALKEYRVVMQNDPFLPPSALELCWRINPDIDALLGNVVPPLASVNASFLDFLASKKETAAAAKVWARLFQLQQPVERHVVFEYVRYLVNQAEVAQARLVWQQAGSLSGLSAYQPSSQNLVVNGDFSQDVLNGGFDWIYQTQPEVSLTMDPTQPHSSSRSLSIVFDSPALKDAGIFQMVPVQPNTNYEFSAFFKAQNLEGAGGPEFVVQDYYRGTTFFASEDLTDADFWKPISGFFTTGPDTTLLLLHIQRVPAGAAIQGKLWVDGVRLAPANTPQAHNSSQTPGSKMDAIP